MLGEASVDSCGDSLRRSRRHVRHAGLQPHYPFGLPLEKWAPDWFLPTGDCGYDNSDVPLGTVLSPLQESIINMYNDAGGWYLIPPMKFMSMAQCCLLGFSVALLIYIVLFAGMMNKRLASK